MVRRRTFWLVFTGLAGLLTGVVFGGPARGDLLPTLTTALPTLPIGTTTVPPAPPLPPAPPVPPVPPVPPAPPPPTVTVPPVPPAPILGAPPAPVAVGTGGGETSRGSGGKTFFASDRPARVHASRTRFATRGPAARRGTKISFRLARPARVELVVRGPSPSCAVAGTTAVRGRRGVNRVRFTGRFHHRPLAPGTYTITVVAVRKGSRHRLGTIPVRVVQPGHAGRGGPRASAMACSASSSPGPASLFALPAAIVRSTTPPTPPAGSHRQPLRPPHVKPPGGILGTGIQPPHIRVPGSTANFGWLTVLLFVMLGVPVILVALYAVRFRRSSPTA